MMDSQKKVAWKSRYIVCRYRYSLTLSDKKFTLSREEHHGNNRLALTSATAFAL